MIATPLTRPLLLVLQVSYIGRLVCCQIWEKARLLRKSPRESQHHRLFFVILAGLTDSKVDLYLPSVCIVGEHIDYMGYAVLPMAVQQDILIACCKNDTNTLNIANTDSKKFPCVVMKSQLTFVQLIDIHLFCREFHVKVSECTIEKGGPWHNYFLCGFRV